MNQPLLKRMIRTLSLEVEAGYMNVEIQEKRIYQYHYLYGMDFFMCMSYIGCINHREKNGLGEKCQDE